MRPTPLILAAAAAAAATMSIQHQQYAVTPREVVPKAASKRKFKGSKAAKKASRRKN